jgi:hypothetical protein
VFCESINNRDFQEVYILNGGPKNPDATRTSRLNETLDTLPANGQVYRFRYNRGYASINEAANTNTFQKLKIQILL